MSSRRLKRLKIDKEIIQRLEKHHIYTCKDLLCLTKLDLLGALGISEKKCRLLIEKVSQACATTPRTACNMLKEKAAKFSKGFFPTSLSVLDSTLLGGLLIGSITEIVGPPSVGKTQFCFMLSVLASMPIEYHGLDANVLYVDTESTFCARRVIEIAKSRLQLNDEDLLPFSLMDRIFVCPVTTSKALKEILYKMECEVVQKKVKLIIIDSIASLLRKEFCSSAERQQMILEISSILKDISEKFDIVVFVTNQISTYFTNFANSTGDENVTGFTVIPDDNNLVQNIRDRNKSNTSVVPALGLAWSHCVNTRLVAQFIDKNNREIALIKSPVAPCVAIHFTIDCTGIVLSDDLTVEAIGINPYLKNIFTKNDFLQEDGYY